MRIAYGFGAALVLAITLIGCGQPDHLDQEATLRKQLETDITPVLSLAKESMKIAVAQNFGTGAAEKATITADKKGVETFGSNIWAVHGQYIGDDMNGVHIERTWTADIQIESGRLKCISVGLGKPLGAR